MRVVKYFERWNAFRLKQDNPFARDFSQAEAAERYHRGETVTAVVVEDDALYAKVEMHKDYLGVNFFDELNREYLIYGFRKQRDDMFFLAEVIMLTFDRDSTDRKSREDNLFSPDGTFQTKITNFETQTVIESKPRTVDVTSNWEPFSQFGDFDGFLRFDRA